MRAKRKRWCDKLAKEYIDYSEQKFSIVCGSLSVKKPVESKLKQTHRRLRRRRKNAVSN